MKTLRIENTPTEVESFADETLEYLKSRETLWSRQHQENRKKPKIVDFSPENIAKFYEESEEPEDDNEAET